MKMRKFETAYIVDAAEMQRADDNTINYFGMPQLVLMERAALMAKDLICRKWPELFRKDPRILIAAGNGNNGGDGVALARLFFLAGHEVTVLVSGKEEKYSPALKIQMDILEKYVKDRLEHGKEMSGGQCLCILTDAVWMREGGKRAGGYDLVVDALFGIGLSRQVTGIWRDKIEWLNRLSGKKAALDIPSGISAKDGSVFGCAFQADLTVTFGFLKRGMLLYPGRELCGESRVADIGITADSFLGRYPAGRTIDRGEWGTAGAFFARKQNSHKGSYGKVLLFSGSIGAPGASLLAGEAVFRSGAGMLQIVSSAENREMVISRLPETMFQALDADTDWEKLLDWCDTAVIGPGIGQSGMVKQSMERILTVMSEKGLRRPVILDADGLNLTASSEKLSRQIKEYTASGGIVVMTPHMAEFARLLHCGIQELQAARMEKTEEYVKETGCILVSKDAATIVAYFDEKQGFRYYINQTGNSGMATAGSGDVLSGIAGALTALTAAGRKGKEEMAAEKSVYFEAAYKAVYLHGLAGDLAAEKYGEASMKSGDIHRMLPELLADHKKRFEQAQVTGSAYHLSGEKYELYT